MSKDSEVKIMSFLRDNINRVITVLRKYGHITHVRAVIGGNVYARPLVNELPSVLHRATRWVRQAPGVGVKGGGGTK